MFGINVPDAWKALVDDSMREPSGMCRLITLGFKMRSELTKTTRAWMITGRAMVIHLTQLGFKGLSLFAWGFH